MARRPAIPPRLRLGAILTLLLLSMTACGTTHIMTTVPGAVIYVNGARLTGEPKIRQRGPPGSAKVEAVAPDGRRATQRIKRTFTWKTFFIGCLTYYTGWLLAWEYPPFVMVAMPEATSGWDDPANDVWLRPPPGWQTPEPVPAEAAPVPVLQTNPDEAGPGDDAGSEADAGGPEAEAP